MATSEPAACRAGDVVVVPFPYSDRLAEKRRPALVVSAPAVAAEGFVWVAMITSAKHQSLRHDRPIGDLAAAGLRAASVVRPVKIAAIEPSRVLRRAGRLAASEIASILTLMRGFIETPSRKA